METTQEQLIEFLQDLLDAIKNSEVKKIEFTDYEINRDHRQVEDKVEIDDKGDKWAVWELTGRETVKFTLFVEYQRRKYG